MDGKMGMKVTGKWPVSACLSHPPKSFWEASCDSRGDLELSWYELLSPQEEKDGPIYLGPLSKVPGPGAHFREGERKFMSCTAGRWGGVTSGHRGVIGKGLPVPARRLLCPGPVLLLPFLQPTPPSRSRSTRQSLIKEVRIKLRLLFPKNVGRGGR